MARKVRTTRKFDRDFSRLPRRVQSLTTQKLDLFLSDATHPSLRVKPIRGIAGIWELSVSMNYRVTFETLDEWVVLRRIGTHDVLRSP